MPELCVLRAIALSCGRMLPRLAYYPVHWKCSFNLASVAEILGFGLATDRYNNIHVRPLSYYLLINI